MRPDSQFSNEQGIILPNYILGVKAMLRVEHQTLKMSHNILIR